MERELKHQHYDAALLWSCTERCNFDCFYCFRVQKRLEENRALRQKFAHFVKNPRSMLKKRNFSRALAAVRDKLYKKPPKKSDEINIPALLRTLDGTNKIFNVVFTGWGGALSYTQYNRSM